MIKNQPLVKRMKFLGFFFGFCLLLSTNVGAATIRFGGILPGGMVVKKKVISMKEQRYVNLVPQSTDFSCGAAALATLLKFAYGQPTSENDVLDGMLKLADPDVIREKGFSLLDMKAYVEARGMQGRGFRIAPQDMLKIKVPVLVLLDIKGYKHFVVVKKTTPDKTYVADPALGNKIMIKEEFESAWNGIIFAVIGNNYDKGTVLVRPADALSAKHLFMVSAPTQKAKALDFGIVPTQYF